MESTNDCEDCETCRKIKDLITICDRAIKAFNDSTIASILKPNAEYNENLKSSATNQPVNLSKSDQKEQ